MPLQVRQCSCRVTAIVPGRRHRLVEFNGERLIQIDAALRRASPRRSSRVEHLG